MNKAELIAAVAEKAGISKKDSEKAINATFDTIAASMEAGEKVQLVGFGVFEVKERGERISVNGRQVKASYQVKVGDVIEIAYGQRTLRVEVTAVTENATKEAAAAMYKELP